MLPFFEFFPLVVLAFLILWGIAYAGDQVNRNREYFLRERETKVKEGMLEINRARFPAAVVPSVSASVPVSQPAVAAAPEAAVAPSQEEAIPVPEVSDAAPEARIIIMMSDECTCHVDVFRSLNYARATLQFYGSLVDRFGGTTGSFADLRSDLSTWSNEDIQTHFEVHVGGWLDAAIAGILPDEDASMLSMSGRQSA